MVKPKNILSLSQNKNAISMRKFRLRQSYLQNIPLQNPSDDLANENEIIIVATDEIVDPQPFNENASAMNLTVQVSNEPIHNISNESSLHEDDTLAQELRECFVLCGTPPTHVSMILKILQKRHPYLPTDSRTLLETPKNLQVRRMGEGRYIHFGLWKKSSELSFNVCQQNLKL